MSADRNALPPRVPASRRRYIDGGCPVCHHEPLGEGRRRVVWTEPEQPGSDRLLRCRQEERCPWSRCPQPRIFKED